MPEQSAARQPHAGIVLAGGLGRRMGGGDKPLLELGGTPMLARVIERLSPQVERIVISANGDPARFARYGLPVVADTIEGFAGPLAGILALRWSQQTPSGGAFRRQRGRRHAVLPARSRAAAGEGCRRDERRSRSPPDGGTHPVFGLWPSPSPTILKRSSAPARRKILKFADRHLRLNVPFDDIRLPGGTAVDPFFNVNTPEYATRAEEIAAALDRVAA